MPSYVGRKARVLVLSLLVSAALSACSGGGVFDGLDAPGGSPPPSGGFGVQQFGTQADDYAGAVAADASGNVYAACFDNGTLVVRKFTSAGSLAWETAPVPISNMSGGFGEVRGIAVGSGAVYAVGSTGPLFSTADGFIAKHNAVTGAPVGLFRFQVQGSAGVGVRGVALDSSGAVYVGGTAISSSQTAFVAKYDWSSGTAPTNVWENTNFGPSDITVNGVAMGAPGTLHAAGFDQKGPTDIDIFIVRIDTSTGVQIGQTIRDGGPGRDSALAVAADAANNTYVAGTTDNVFSGSSAGSNDIIAAKYDASGNNVWRFQTGSAKGERAETIALGNGSIYVAGFTEGNLLGATNKDPSLQSSDVFLMKIPNASAGPITPTWTRMYGSTGFQNNIVDDEALGAAVCPDGGVAVVGYTAGGSFEGANAAIGNWDGILFKVSASGNLDI